MADDPDSFKATIDNWVKQTPERILAVFKQSTQEVASRAANAVPVDTGFARASVRASLSAMPAADQEKPKGGVAFPFDFSEVTLTIANAKLTDAIYIGWTANYAIYLEYGQLCVGNRQSRRLPVLSVSQPSNGRRSSRKSARN